MVSIFSLICIQLHYILLKSCLSMLILCLTFSLALEYTGGVPFSILEPILKHASPDQLYNLEQYNDYLIEDTGVLWEYHCKKEFRSKVPNKNETWRNFYIVIIKLSKAFIHIKHLFSYF